MSTECFCLAGLQIEPVEDKVGEVASSGANREAEEMWYALAKVKAYMNEWERLLP